MDACRNKTLAVAAINVSTISVIYGEIQNSVFELTNMGSEIAGVRGKSFKILQVLSSKMQFQYTLVTPEDGNWGNCDDNGHCTGMIGMLARNEAHMAICDITYTTSRARYVDFSYPYFHDEITFATKNIEAYEEVNSDLFFAQPFDRSVWIFLASLLIVFVSLVKILEYFQLLRTKIMSLQLMLKIILRQSINLERKRIKLSVIVTLLVFVVTAGCTCKLYECVVTSVASLAPINQPIDTISDMLDAIREKDYVISAPKDTACYELIMTSKVEYVKIFAQSTLNRNFEAPRRNEKCVEMVLRGKFALVEARSYIIRTLVKMNLQTDTLHLGQDNLFIDHIAIALSKHFPCKDDLNKWLNVLIDSGLIGKWHSEDMTLFNQSTRSIDHISVSSYIAMNDLKLIFVSLFCGYLFGLLSLLMELMTQYCYTRLPIGAI